MSFGNQKPKHPQNSKPQQPNDQLAALNQLGGLNDLASNSLNDLGSAGKDLSKDLNNLKSAKSPQQLGSALDHGAKDVGKLGNDLGKDLKDSPLGAMNDLSNDLMNSAPKDNQSTGDPNDPNNQANADNAKEQQPKNPYDALKDIGDVGSLMENSAEKGKAAKGDKDPKDALKDLNRLSNDLNNPKKIKDPMKDLKAAERLKNGGMGALGFGPLEDAVGGSFSKGDPLLDKVADGSIRPQDLKNAKYQQRRNNNNARPPYRPRRSLFHKLRDGAKNLADHAKRSLRNGFAKMTSGIITGVKAMSGKTIAAATATKIAITGMAIPALVGGSIVTAVYNDYNDYQVLDDGNVCGVANDAGTGMAEAMTGAAGMGANNTKLAKHIFMSWVHVGCSGAAAAGICGYIMGEGGLGIPDKAEGCGADTKKCEIAFGAKPSPVASGYSVGGGGIYQLTPYTDFAPVGSKKWLDVDAQTRYFLHHKILRGGWNTNYDYSHKAPSFKAFAHLKDPKDACDAWDAAEIGNVYDSLPRREAMAKHFYKQFNGEKYSANDSLLGKLAGSVADTNSAEAETTNDQECKNNNGNGGPVVAGKWGWPYPGFKKSDIDSPFADTNGRNWHDGIDIGTAHHQGKICAIHGGKVVSIDLKGTSQSSMGFFVAVQSPDGYTEVYQEYAFSWSSGKAVTKVKKGDSVRTGQVICEEKSSTPNCTHIHIGVYHGTFSKMMSVGEPHYSEPGFGWVDPIKCIEKSKGN